MLTDLEDLQAKMNLELRADYVVAGLNVSAIMFASVLGSLFAAGVILCVQIFLSEAHVVLRWSLDGSRVETSWLASKEHYHLFISFRWGSGKQQAQALKDRLQLVLPGLRCWFAVDDLIDISQLDEIQRQRVNGMIAILTGHVEDGIEHSDYFQSEREPKGSKYCTREFELMLQLERVLVCVLETLPEHGGVSLQTHQRACPDSLQFGFGSRAVVSYHRAPGFKEASLRLIIEHALPAVAENVPASPLVFLASEVTREPLALPPPAKQFHVYVSPYNPSAASVAQVLQKD